jgi:hypothetical protein
MIDKNTTRTNVALVVITDGRKECIERTIARFNLLVLYRFAKKIIINDSGSPEYHKYLCESYKDFKIISHKERKGLSSAIQSAWLEIDETIDFVFHLEDDFLFTEKLNINKMITILRDNTYLAQIALVRNAYYPDEIEVGGFVFKNIDNYSQKKDFFEHKGLFTLNPSIYPKTTVEIGWPDGGDEPHFTSKILKTNPDARFGFYGNIYDPPRVKHIGHIRSENWKI